LLSAVLAGNDPGAFFTLAPANNIIILCGTLHDLLRVRDREFA
jgi:hypothetical protein